MCSHSISSPFLLLQERLRSESMSGAEQRMFKVLNSSHLFTFISHYRYKMVCISIILAHMLASLDCVPRQECWEPFLPKHLQRVFNHHKKDNHWSIDVQTENSIPIHQRTKITWEMTNNMKALSSLINHMLPHDQQKKTRFLTSFITPNMTIFASKDLPNVFMMKTLLPHVYK
jgi:hypothetical protein